MNNNLEEKEMKKQICNTCKKTFNSNYEYEHDEQKICPSCYF